MHVSKGSAHVACERSQTCILDTQSSMHANVCLGAHRKLTAELQMLLKCATAVQLRRPRQLLSSPGVSKSPQGRNQWQHLWPQRQSLTHRHADTISSSLQLILQHACCMTIWSYF